MLDWFSRFVLAWRLADSLEIGFVLECAQSLLTQATPEIWNNDQGSHFTRPEYTDLLLAAQVQISIDGRGRARDNISIERLWRSVKYEEVYLHEYYTPRDARTGLGQVFQFCSTRRPHQSLAYCTPAAVYLGQALLPAKPT